MQYLLHHGKNVGTNILVVNITQDQDVNNSNSLSVEQFNACHEHLSNAISKIAVFALQECQCQCRTVIICRTSQICK